MKENILIIEPEQKDQNDLQDFFSDTYKITFVENIPEAIDSTRKNLHKVIIYNLGNPGYEVITGLMELKRNSEDIPIITITSENSLDIERKIRGIGIFYYLLKPYKFRDLDILIHAAVQVWERKFKFQNHIKR